MVRCPLSDSGATGIDITQYKNFLLPTIYRTGSYTKSRFANPLNSLAVETLTTQRKSTQHEIKK